MSRFVMHPTKERLIETVSTMLDSDTPGDVIVDEVLNASGISRGSLYHHFEDFSDLIEQTLMLRFSRGVDETTGMMMDVLAKAKTQEEFWEGMHQLTVFSQSPLLARRRAERARIVGMTTSSDRLSKMLAAEQDRLTSSITEIVIEVQRRDWMRQDVDPRATAVFIQAYTLGRVVDDISETHVSSDEWSSLIRLIVGTLQK